MNLLSISESILKYVSGFGIVQGILLSLLIYFHPRSDRSVNKFLALYILFFSIVMSLPFILEFTTWKYSYFQQPLPLLTGPFLYFYIRSFKETITWRKIAPHLIFFVLFYIPTYLNVTSFAVKYPQATTLPPEILHSPATIIINNLKFGQSIFYFFLCRRTLKVYQRSIRHMFSETSNIDMGWARSLINGFMVIVSTAVVAFALMMKFPEYFNLLFLAIMAISTPYIYIAAYKGIVQPNIWQMKEGVDKQEIEKEIIEAEKITEPRPMPSRIKKLRSFTLPAGRAHEIIQRITQLMEVDKLYQETELTLQDLSEKLDVPSYQVSLAINEGMNKSFYELVNSYRVEEAKELLQNPGNRNYTILSVGYEAGFNSKTTFNSVFKKFTGFTPTDYREQQALAVSA